MTIAKTGTESSYAGDNSSVAFSFPYRFFVDTDLKVYVVVDSTNVSTLQTLTTHYAITNTGTEDGGTITMVTPPATGETLLIQRSIPKTQGTDYATNDAFPAETHEAALDRLTLLAQGNESGHITFPFGDDSASVLDAVSARAGKIQGFGPSGELLTYSVTPIFTVGDVLVYDTVTTLLASTEAARGNGSIWEAGGFRYIEVASGGDITNSATTPVELDVIIESDGFFPFGAMGADDTGVADATAAVNTALASHLLLKFPAGTFLVSDIGVLTGMHIKGAGEGEVSQTTLLVGTNDQAAFYANTTSAHMFNVKIENLECKIASGVTGARFIRQTSKEYYLAYWRISGCETWQELEVTYDIWPIFMVLDHCRDGYRGSAVVGQTHQAMSCIPAAYGQTNQSNLNKIASCRFFRSTNTTGAFDIHYGVNWSFSNCDWETITGRAVNAEGIYNLTIDTSWFEGVDATEVIRATVSTAPNAQGSRPTVIQNSHCYMHANNTHFIELGSASTASIEHCTFANIPASAVLSTDNTRLRSILDTIALSGAGSSTFLPTQGSDLKDVTINTAEITSANTAALVVDGRYQPFQLKKTGLTDAPGSPETVATFTMPALSLELAQELDSVIVDIDAVVTAVATTTTINIVNRQRLRVFMIMKKGGAVAANIATSDSVSLNDGGSWTSAPVWSVTVAGAAVTLLMTSNPAGGTYTGGITARIVGEIRSTGSEDTFTMPTYA